MNIQCSRTFCPPNTWVFPTYAPEDNVFVAPDDWDFDFEDYTVDIAYDMRPYTFIKTPEGHVYRVKGCRVVTETVPVEPSGRERVVIYSRLELTPAAWLWRGFPYRGYLLSSSRIFPTSAVAGRVTGIYSRKIILPTSFDLLVTVQGAGFVSTYAVAGVTQLVTRGGGTAADPDVVVSSGTTPLTLVMDNQGRCLAEGAIFTDYGSKNFAYEKILAAYIVPSQGFTYDADAMCIYDGAGSKGEEVLRIPVIRLPDYTKVTTGYSGVADVPCIMGAALEAQEYSPGLHTLKYTIAVYGRVQITVDIDGDVRDITDYFSIAFPVKGDAYWWQQNGVTTTVSVLSSAVGTGAALGSGQFLGALTGGGSLISALDKLNQPKGLNYSPAGSGILNASRGFVRFDLVAYDSVAHDTNGAYTTNAQVFSCGEYTTLADIGRAEPEYFCGKFSPAVPGVAVVDRAVCEELAGGVWIQWR